MDKAFSSLREAFLNGQNAVLCTVVRSSGSTPCKPGCHMLVMPDGTTAGTVGGGTIELLASREGKSVLESRADRLCSYSLKPNGHDGIGMLCGGDVSVLFQYIDALDDVWGALLQTICEKDALGRKCWRVIRYSEGQSSENLLIDTMEETEYPHFFPVSERPALLKDSPVFVSGEPLLYAEPICGSERVFLFGAGHIGQALCPILHVLGFRVTVLDNRPDFAVPERLPEAERVLLTDYLCPNTYEEASEGDYAVVMTHSHAFDYDVLKQVLTRPFRYIGCLGSPGKAQTIRERLAKDGFPEEEIQRIHSPVGLMIGARSPQEIAVSIAAEIIACRHDRIQTK